MILVFPQATKKFNNLFEEMISQSCIDKFLDKSLGSYEIGSLEKVVFILLENEKVEKYLKNYLKKIDAINSYEILSLKKETSGSICTTLMAIPMLKGKKVIISALDQIIEEKLDFDSKYFKGDHDIISPIYRSEDPSLSYILKDDDENVIQVFEKRLVSNDAILGVYLIKDFSLFYKSCHELLIKYKGFKNRIFYTSDVINHYLGGGFKCGFPLIDNKYYKIRSINDFNAIKWKNFF